MTVSKNGDRVGKQNRQSNRAAVDTVSTALKTKTVPTNKRVLAWGNITRGEVRNL
jgi:Neuraminidase (sialidase)